MPDWLPWWGALVVLIPVLIYALLYLAVPFSVLGLKARLEGIEDRLDEIQHEIRALSLRLPEQEARPPIPPRQAEARPAPRPRPTPDDDDEPVAEEAFRPDLRAPEPRTPRRPPLPGIRPQAERSEPRIGWPS